MSTVAILGGGISGLSCAYYLKTLGQSKIRYLFLLEKSSKFGGWIQTTRFPDGAIFEHGPRTLRVNSNAGCNALALAEDLNLTSRILPVTREHPTAKSNLILAKEELHPLPIKLTSILRTVPPFTKPFLSYLFNDFSTKKTEILDESIYSFGTRRAGKEIADYVLDPMCRGIAAGDAKELSIRSMFPSVYHAEQDHGSVVKGFFKNRNQNDVLSYKNSALVSKSYNEVWRMWTLKNGLSELVETLACSVEEKGVADLHFNAECTDVTFKDNKAMVSVDGEKIEVDHVFSCIPSNHLSKLLKQNQSLNSVLSSIPSVDMAVVYLEYEQNVLEKEGFGFLTPSFENSKVLGIVFDSCCFPELNGNSKTRITCMIGGKWFNQILGNVETVSKDHILHLAIEEAKRHLKIKDNPVRHEVVIQKSCIPQYVVGHYKKLDTIENEIVHNKLCLTLLGASYKGAGVPDCIYNARLGVLKYLASI